MDCPAELPGAVASYAVDYLHRTAWGPVAVEATAQRLRALLGGDLPAAGVEEAVAGWLIRTPSPAG
ncbi:hypothetical protein [Frankia sp. AgB32]|uniref:hypothetical protein n=1 Tax=Frankia sp. AgB32 TaxID=631119 RepID=UPI0020109E52|nr:hypothetical protein [Frankia sp. AgB32]MCK9893676.1 hypothetical protein [Frankia sp. AgB32]